MLLASKPAKLKKSEFAPLYLKAHAAGLEAAKKVVPVPMIVAQHASVLDDSSPVVKSWYVPSGVCGFAWVSVKPGNSGFAKWLVANGYASKDSYAGGVCLWVSLFGQSLELKESYAYAFARVLQEAGIKAYGNSRMD